MAQRVYFDPTKPFERRLFHNNQGQSKTVQPNYVKKAASAQKEEMDGEEGIHKHSLKRVKKKINDFILTNYEKLFFKQKSPAASGDQSGKPTPNQSDDKENSKMQEEGEQTLSA